MSRPLHLCALAALLITGGARADDTKAGGFDSGDLFYAGVGAERVDTNFNNVDPPINLNFLTGVHIPTIDWISAELAGSFTIIPGKNDNEQGGILGKVDCIGGVPNVPPGCTIPDDGGGDGDDDGEDPQTSDDLRMFNIGLYLALRSPGRFYATGKIGYRYLVTSIDTSDGDLYDKRSGVAWSAGLGWRWGDSLSGVEALYTGYGGGINAIGLGVVYGFGGR